MDSRTVTADAADACDVEKAIVGVWRPGVFEQNKFFLTKVLSNRCSPVGCVKLPLSLDAIPAETKRDDEIRR